MAYLRLLWMYYDTESVLPNNPENLAFQIGASTVDVAQILAHFFVLDGDFYRQIRCDKVILDYKNKAEKAAKSANARWNNANGMRTHSERIANAPNNHANQEPRTKNQEPIVKNKSAGASAYADLVSQVDPEILTDWKKLRAAKKSPVTRLVLEGMCREAGLAGYTLEQAMREGVERGWTSFKASWVIDKGGGRGVAQPNKQQALEDRADETLRQYLADKELKNNVIQ
jgi:uncharacterized protein YdaU (DUF1376 family)